MKKEWIVICDEDEEYVEAFASYLMGQMQDIAICTYTDKEAFLEDGREYALGILSKGFLEVAEFSCKENIAEKMYLCDEDIAVEYEHLPMVYKYQSMEIVVEMLRRRRKKQQSRISPGRQGRTGKLMGIFSPISHELQLPYALSVCQVCQEQGSVLFLDLEEFSILPEFMGGGTDEDQKTILDILYLLQSECGSRLDLQQYVRRYMGIDYLLPFSDPEEIGRITSDQWQGLFGAALDAGYDTVVVLFGRVTQGFWELAALCQEFFVLGKPGDYYQKTQKNFMNHAAVIPGMEAPRSVQLPMSAGNLSDGTYRMEELIQGNLGVYVRRQMEQMLLMRQGAGYAAG